MKETKMSPLLCLLFIASAAVESLSFLLEKYRTVRDAAVSIGRRTILVSYDGFRYDYIAVRLSP